MLITQYEMSLLVLAFVVSHLVSCALLMGTMLLIHRYEVPDNSRIVLGAAYFFTAAVWTIWLVVHFLMPAWVNNYPVLSPFLLGFSMIFVQLVSLYLLEVKRPSKATNPLKLAGYLAPGILVGGALLACIGNYHVLDYFSSIGRFVRHVDVWVRLLALGLTLAYSFVILLSQANRFRSSASKAWEMRWFLLTLLLVALVVATSLTRDPICELIYYIYLVLFTALLGYGELEIRIVVSAPPAHADRKVFEAHKEKLSEEESKAAEKEAADEAAIVEARNALLWARIQNQMKQEVWRSPDLDINALSLMVLSNRTYVSQCISEHYEGGFKEMINRCRVEAVKAKVDAGSDEPWNDLFFEVGYRSRTTAWRNFTQYIGISPADYRVKGE